MLTDNDQSVRLGAAHGPESKLPVGRKFSRIRQVINACGSDCTTQVVWTRLIALRSHAATLRRQPNNRGQREDAKGIEHASRFQLTIGALRRVLNNTTTLSMMKLSTLSVPSIIFARIRNVLVS